MTGTPDDDHVTLEEAREAAAEASRPGDTYANPLRINRDQLDVSAVRAHFRAMHMRFGQTVPRANLDVASLHARDHHRHHLDHIHRGPFTLVGTPHNPRAVGQIVRPLGDYTGQEPVTRAELKAEWQARRTS
jgi:hypothetical protein